MIKDHLQRSPDLIYCARTQTLNSDFIKQDFKKEKIKNSDIHFQVKELPLEIILFLIAKIKNVELKKLLTSFLLQFRNIKLEIKGKDLKALGLEPGPEFSEIFRTILSAKVEGKVKNKREEIAMAKRLSKKKQKIK